MDLQRVVSKMVVCSFVILAASVIGAAAINHSNWSPYSHTDHREGGLYDIDHLNNHMAGGLISLQPQSGYDDFDLNERNMLERDRHEFPSSMDRHEKRDVQALLSFKKHIKSDPSGKLSNWTAENSKEVCSWYGITCRRETKRVVAVVLLKLQLGGTLSPSLGNLSLLHTLDLSLNNFQGGIPPEFGRLKALRILDLRSTYDLLRGSTWKSLLNCTRLSYLDLSLNSLSGPIPSVLGLMRSLSHLDLSWNSLSGRIPPALSNCTQLLYIDFSFNKLSGTIPALSNYDKLSYINFGANHLSGTIPAFLNYTQLLHIDFFGNNISGKIPVQLGSLQKLETLDLSFNQLENIIPSALGNCSSLKSLFLGKNLLSGSIPPQLASLANTSCELLDLRKNQLDGELPGYLAKFQYLRVLSIAYNNLHGSIPQSITNLTKLQVLDLSNNKFSGSIPANLQRLQGYKVNASSELSDKIDVPFSIVIKKNEYTLEYVLVTNTIMDLSSNNLTGEIPQKIGTLSSMRLLNLSRNHFEGHIPASFSEISTLEQLDVAKNNLSGRIPQELSKLSMLAVLDVSYNNLCGPIPTGTQFSTFEAASFKWNKCLWGCPLDQCNNTKIPVIEDNNSGKNNNVKVGWLSHVDEKISLMALGIGVGIGIWGVVIVFIMWKRARNWVLGLPHKKLQAFYGVYRLPT